MLNLAIDIDDILILIELLYPGVLLSIVLFIHSAVAPAIIINFGFWLFHAGRLVHARGRVHRRLLLPFVHEVGLVRDCALVGLRSVVQNGVGHILEERGSDKLRALLWGDRGCLLTPHYHLFLALLDSRAARKERQLDIMLSLISPARYAPLVLWNLVACSIDWAYRSNRAHGILKLLLRPIITCHVRISSSQLIISAIGLIKFQSELLVDDVPLLRKLSVCFRAFLPKRFIVGSTILGVGHYLRRAQSVTVLHAIHGVISAFHKLTPGCSYTILVLFLGALTQSWASCTKIGLSLPSLDRIEWVLDLFLLTIDPLSIGHIAVIILLGPCYNGICTSGSIIIVHLSYLVLRCYVGQLNKIFKESLMILALVANPPKLFGVAHLYHLLSRVLALWAWIEQYAVGICEKLFVTISDIFASSKCLFFHLNFHVILIIFGVILALA